LTTIRFLAGIAGVAPSTVSRALRNDPSIGAPMRLHIQSLAREYHYHPNQLMHGLLTGQSGVIGIALPQLTISFNAAILSAMLDSVMDAGFRSMIFETYCTLEKTQYAIHAMIEQRVDGALLYTGRGERLPPDLLLGLRSHGIPAISIDAVTEDIQLDTVRTDEEQLASLAVDYLISLGHQRIAWLNHIVNARSLAIITALRKRKLTTCYCLEPVGRSYEHVADVEVIETLLTRYPRPTALIAGDDHIAGKVLTACHTLHITVPDELSVIGCGNLAVGEFTHPALTTIDQRPKQIGQTAMACLQERLQTPDEPRSPSTHFISSHLIQRASCARV
jgi:LacI family transcriptional regulator